MYKSNLYSPKMRRHSLPTTNPHCEQALIYGRPSMNNVPFTRIIAPSAKRRKYAERGDEQHTVVFQYYRRELIESIEFLIDTITPGEIDEYVFLFVGAAPGYDVAYLRKLFPSLRFVLFDPKPIVVDIEGPTEIHQEFFTDEWAHRLKEEFNLKRILLQCYTRISSHRLESNLRMIQNWHTIMGVYRGAYEVTLPYNSDGTTTFTKGDLYFPVWSKPAGADCRLITDAHTTQTIALDHRRHEEAMAYFNCITRTCVYLNEFKLPSVYDECYDCTAEKRILFSYISNFLGIKDLHRARHELRLLSLDIHQYFCNECPQLPDWFVRHPRTQRPGPTQRTLLSQNDSGSTPNDIYDQ
jgi:hypothetical protein